MDHIHFKIPAEIDSFRYKCSHVMFVAVLLKLLIGIVVVAAEPFRGNAPPGVVDLWCGKAYQPENASFNPGGWLETPGKSSSPLLDLQIRPRMNIFLEDDSLEGSLIVDTSVTHMTGVGQPFNWTTSDHSKEILVIHITRSDTKRSLFKGIIPVNSKSNEIKISLSENFTPRLLPYDIDILATSLDGKQSFNSSTQLYHLPSRTDGGSATKLDNLHGGLLVKSITKGSADWTGILPYSYYTGLYDLQVIDEFVEAGYNIIHIIPDSSLENQTFVADQLDSFMKRCAEVGLWVMYDMRWTYMNTSSVVDQVLNVKHYESLLLYYTGDEPDGSVDPLDAPRKTYEIIKSLDPYHPVSLCLNCQNFYYKEYSSGADIILSDPYPIAVNMSFSDRFHTVCNTTYGDCGCDNCRGDFQDVSERFDLYNEFQEQLGLGPKTMWSVPQAFGGSEYWSRVPTPEEEIVLHMLSINHLVKGIVSWVYPSSLNGTTSKLAKLITSQLVSKFLLGSRGEINLPVEGGPKLDVTAWILGNQMLVSVIQADYANITGTVSITLPLEPTGLNCVLYGDELWKLDDRKISKAGVKGLEFDLLVFDVHWLK